MESKELILKHVKVIFAELEDKGFGRNRESRIKLANGLKSIISMVA